MGEASLCRDFESLSLSKRLMRNVSQKLKNKSRGDESEDDDDDGGDDAKGVSLRCLNLYGKAGGCEVGADTSEEFGDRRRSSASEEGKRLTMICGTDEATVDCFSYGVDKFWKRNSRRGCLDLEESPPPCRLNVFLPDDVLEMCLVRLPLTSLMNARLVCRKWRILTSSPRFLQIRNEGPYRSPWLFMFGMVKSGYCSGEIHAFDVCLNQWHRIDSELLKGRFLFSVVGIHEDVYVVGGCSSLTNFGKMDRSSFKTHKGVLVFNAITKSWRKIASMKYARSTPTLGISEISSDTSILRNQQQNRQDRHVLRSRFGGVSDVYEDPHRLSVRRHFRSSLDENDSSLFPSIKPYKFAKQKSNHSKANDSRRFVLIAVGGVGSWDEPLDSGEIYDSATNKWIEIQRLPVDFGAVCSGVVCKGTFYVYSETDKIAGYDIERGYWIVIQTTPSPSRVHEYLPKLISCSERLFMLSVSWCEGDGQIGRRNKAVRKLWELDLACLSWLEVSIHPDAPMDWNAAFVGDGNLIFGVEMFKIFGQVLDFLTTCDISNDTTINWSHISRNHVSHELDAASCMTKSMAVLRL